MQNDRAILVHDTKTFLNDQLSETAMRWLRERRGSGEWRRNGCGATCCVNLFRSAELAIGRVAAARLLEIFIDELNADTTLRVYSREAACSSSSCPVFVRQLFPFQLENRNYAKQDCNTSERWACEGADSAPYRTARVASPGCALPAAKAERGAADEAALPEQRGL
jgi:hypothetical protein